MAIANGAGLPLAAALARADPAETSLFDTALAARLLRRRLTRLIGEEGDDRDKLDTQLAARGIEFIAANRNTRHINRQHGRRLRRSCRCWKIQRLFAWLQTSGGWARHEHHVESFLGFVQLACIVILSRQSVR